MKDIIRFKAFWVCIFFLVVALLANCVFDTSGMSVGVGITSSQPSKGCRNAAYSFQFTADNGVTPYTWSIKSGTKPPGLNLDAATGVLSGVPSTNGTYSFKVQVKDKTTDNAYDDFTISIRDFNITNGDESATYCPGLPFEYQFYTCGGTPPFAWTIPSGSGSPPSGISITSSGTLSGTTSATGKHSFTVVVSDSGGATPAEKAFTLSPATLVQIASSRTLPQGQTSKTYTSYPLEACGGTAPYTWTDPNGDVPLGLNLSSLGLITGTPTKAGTFTFLLKVEDSASSPQFDSEYFTLEVTPSALAITSASPLANASECLAYSATMSASGGTGSYSWKFAAGSQKPSWLSLNSLGVLSGTPTAPVSTPHSLTIELSDGKAIVSKMLQLSVSEYPAATAALIIPEIRHKTGAYNIVSLSQVANVKVDFRFSSASYLNNVVTTAPATLQVIGNCTTISTTNFSAIQDINGDGQQEMAARFDPSQVAALLTAAGKASGDSAKFRFTVKVKIDVTTQTFVQTANITVAN
jgi:hypothetical protein